MFAKCARVEPAIASSSTAPAWTVSVCLSCATDTPLTSLSDSEPLAPFSVTAPAATVAVTPCGSATGFFATLDIVDPLRNHAQDFAALADAARLTVGHDALRGRNYRDAEATEHLRQPP